MRKSARCTARTAPERRRTGHHDGYHTVALVRADSALTTAEDLIREAESQHLEYRFVHPLSVSGRVAPEWALQRMGIKPSRGEIAFTWSHAASVRQLQLPPPKREQVAFVWDGTGGRMFQNAKDVRPLVILGLSELRIPQDVVVARSGFRPAARLQELLLAHIDGDGRSDCLRSSDAPQQYQQVRDWYRASNVSADVLDEQRISLNEIGRILLHHTRTQPTPLRLAVVFSGGGGKMCVSGRRRGSFGEEASRIAAAEPGK